jgi:hypothetical protein
MRPKSGVFFLSFRHAITGNLKCEQYQHSINFEASRCKNCIALSGEQIDRPEKRAANATLFLKWEIVLIR